MQQWQPDFCNFSNIFSHIKQILNDSRWNEWPSCQQLNQLLPADIVNQQGQPLVLVEQTEQLLSDGLYYEQRIFEQGVVPTRSANWHDFFNALIYLLFPKTKKEINRLHCQHIDLYGQQKRSKCRDALTLLDECGVLIPYCDQQIVDKLQSHQWKRAFVEQRTSWGQSIDAIVIGHANYEKALTPYIGFTGKALYLKVAPDFFNLPTLEKYSHLDTILSASLEHLMQDNSQLFPLPMLGVPGWWDDNKDPTFYDNSNYFRAKRSIKPSTKSNNK